MKQKSPLTVLDLANECVSAMKEALGFFSNFLPNQEKEAIAKLEKFLETQPASDEAILNEFKSISQAFSSDKLKKLSQAFISRITWIQVGFNHRTHNQKNSEFLRSLLSLPSDIMNAFLSRNWNTFWLRNFVLVCKDFYGFFAAYKNLLTSPPSNQSPSIESPLTNNVAPIPELIKEKSTPKNPTVKTIDFFSKTSNSEKNTSNPSTSNFSEENSDLSVYIPSHGFLNSVVFLDNTNLIKLYVFDFNTQKKVAVLEHTQPIFQIGNNVAGDCLIVLTYPEIYIWHLPDGKLMETLPWPAHASSGVVMEEFVCKYSIGWQQVIQKPAKIYSGWDHELELTVEECLVKSDEPSYEVSPPTSNKTLKLHVAPPGKLLLVLTQDCSRVFTVYLRKIPTTNLYFNEWNIQSNELKVKEFQLRPNFLKFYENPGNFSMNSFVVTPDNRYFVVGGIRQFDKWMENKAEIALYDLEKNTIVSSVSFKKEALAYGQPFYLFLLSNGRIVSITSEGEETQMNGCLKNSQIQVIEFPELLASPKKEESFSFIEWRDKEIASSLPPITAVQNTSMSTSATSCAAVPVVFTQPAPTSQNPNIPSDNIGPSSMPEKKLS